MYPELAGLVGQHYFLPFCQTTLGGVQRMYGNRGRSDACGNFFDIGKAVVEESRRGRRQEAEVSSAGSRVNQWQRHARVPIRFRAR